MNRSDTDPTEPVNLVVRKMFNPNGVSSWFTAVVAIINQLTLLTIVLTGAASAVRLAEADIHVVGVADHPEQLIDRRQLRKPEAGHEALDPWHSFDGIVTARASEDERRAKPWRDDARPESDRTGGERGNVAARSASEHQQRRELVARARRWNAHAIQTRRNR
jgi:hypothetical protein